MANKLQGPIIAGSTSFTTGFVLLSATDGSEMTGKLATDLTLSYWRQGGLRVAISPSDLAAVDSAYASGGVKEIDATNMRGSYRLDVPDAALASGADWVEINALCSGSQVFKERFPIATAGAVEVKAETANIGAILSAVNAIKAITDTIVVVGGKVTAAITAAADLAQAAADKVWASATRQLTAFGFTVSLATSVWDEVAASHNTAGTTGAKLNSAAAVADPWSAIIPGSYVAGEAGYVLGNLADDSVEIAAIKAKTDQLTFSTPNVVDASSTGGLTASAIATAVHTQVMTESYAADGVQVTLAQALYLIQQFLLERTLVSTTLTIKKLDGSSTAAVITTNSATNPTSYTRSA